MIPWASVGVRPRDQWPFTALEVVYRPLAKGVVQGWGPTLQQHLLGQVAFGFRSQTGTVHAVQVLVDLINLSRCAYF